MMHYNKIEEWLKKDNVQAYETSKSSCRNSNERMVWHFMAHPCFCKIAGIINGYFNGLLYGIVGAFMVPAITMKILPFSRRNTHKQNDRKGDAENIACY